jgi:hypothetical protein
LIIIKFLPSYSNGVMFYWGEVEAVEAPIGWLIPSDGYKRKCSSGREKNIGRLGQKEHLWSANYLVLCNR